MEFYFTVDITFKNEELGHYPDILAISESYDCDGVEEFSLIEAEVDELLGDRAYSGGDIPLSIINEIDTRVTGKKSFKFYFSSGQAEDRAKSFFSELQKSFNFLDAKLLKENSLDWNSEWRKHYTSIDVSENLKIIPEWEKGEKNLDSEIYIYPGMGFGTGDHGTTFLCLKIYDAIKDKFTSNAECLDLGCGSGILGIAAEKLGGMNATFVDVDPLALENTEQNYLLNIENKASNKILRSNYDSNRKFDLVFANILFHVLVDEKKLIIDSMKDGGTLILSGLLKEQKNSILEEYSELKFEHYEEKGDWIAVMLRRI